MGGTQYSQTSMTRDAWGNVTAQTAWSGYGTATSAPTSGARTNSTAYDSTYHAYAVSTTDALNHTTTVTYNYSLGLPVSETDPNGATTSVTYDSFGRSPALASGASVTGLTKPGDATPTLTVSYQTSPFVVTLNQVIDATHTFTVTRYYDGLGRQYQTNTNGVLVNSTFNAFGKPLTQSTPHSGSETVYYTTTAYDALGRPDLITAPDGTQTDYIYNGLTTTVSTKINGSVFNGHTMTTFNDIWGRTKLITPPTGPTVSFNYDPLGNLTSATRGGVTTTLTYDNAGRKKTMTDPDMGFWQYEYDALGSMIWQIDARNCTINFAYDLLTRPTSKTYSGCSATPPVTYIYDDQSTNGIGRRHSVSDGSGLTTWSYDIRGRVISEARQIDSNQFVTSWTYNQADLPVSMTYPDGEIINFTYDNKMMLTSVTGLDSYLQSAAYDSAGRLTQRVLGNNVITSTYDYFAWNTPSGAGRLQSAVHTNSTLTLQTFTYGYDLVGNITNIYDALSGETQNFGYDALDRLTSASAVDGIGNYSESYAYNSTSGNLETKGNLTLQYLDSNHVHAVTDAGGNSYQYDANGNQITRIIGSDTYTLIYDAENRLVEVKKNNTTIAQFTFDGDGRRVKSVIGGETTLFVGGHYEMQGTNISKYYFAGAQRIAMRKNGTLNFLLSDHLGSTSITTDVNGDRVSETRYNAWGEVRFTEGVVPTKYSFTGQYSHVEDFGLMYYGARWYDNVTGRFVQADTMIPPGPQGQDRYAYVNNSPIRYVDPSGHMPSDGCRGDSGGCTLSQSQKDRDAQDDAMADAERDKARCEAGDEKYCPNTDELAEVGIFVLSFLFEPADWFFTISACLQGDCSVLSLVFMAIPGLNGREGDVVNAIVKKYGDDLLAKLPFQNHHILTNINKAWTGKFSDIATKYGLNLNGSWNIVNIPHRGRHPNSYHNWVFGQLTKIDNAANGNTDDFLKMFSGLRQFIIDNPLVVRGIGLPGQ
jgi:RHS repeat-associated protein